MRTTLTLDDDVAAALKRAQASSGASFKAVVNETLRKGLVNGASKPKKRPRRAVILPIDMGKTLGHRVDKTWDLVEFLEGPNFKRGCSTSTS